MDIPYQKMIVFSNNKKRTTRVVEGRVGG